MIATKTDKTYLVLNATAHQFTQKQFKALKEIIGKNKKFEIKELPKELKDKLLNCPDNDEELLKLANELTSFIAQNDIDYLHLPIGSPAFMFLFAALFDLFLTSHGCTILFSHSVRKSIEQTNPDGTVTKSSVFEFEKFIEI